MLDKNIKENVLYQKGGKEMAEKKEKSLTMKARQRVEKKIEQKVKTSEIAARTAMEHLNELIEHGHATYRQLVLTLRRDLKKAIMEMYLFESETMSLDHLKKIDPDLGKLYEVLEEIEKKEKKELRIGTEETKELKKELKKIPPKIE